MKKIKLVALQAFICNALLFLSMVMVGRGVKKLSRDIRISFKFLGRYLSTSYGFLKVLALLGVVVILGYLVYALVNLFKNKKKVFGPLYIAIPLYFVALIIAHPEVIKMTLNEVHIVNLTCGVFIITSAALSLFYLLAYGSIDTYQMVEELDKNKETKVTPVNENPTNEQPTEEKQEETIVSETVEPEEKIEEATISSVAIVVEESENSEQEEIEVEKGYALTEEGYLPLDDSPKSVSFQEDFIPLFKNRKKMYSDVKNAIMAYKVKNVPIKAADQFKIGNTTILRITAYKDDILVYLAIDPYSIEPNAYFQYDADAKYNDTPCCIKVHSKATVERVKQLIVLMKQQFQLEVNEDYKKQDYSSTEDTSIKETETM